jgi:NAD(P)-dependent dehydrogenase (short-subunit alcohol dehydrogenase family)
MTLRIFITGANRGIGLALTQQALARGDHVFAGVRHPDTAHELRRLAQQYTLTVLPLDVTDEDSISAALNTVRAQTSALDVVINNAAINPETPPYETFGQLEAAAMLEVLHTNTVAPLLVAQAFVSLLTQGDHPRLINISTEMASLANRTYGGSHSYCMSKAALNMASRGLAADLKGRKIVVVALDPGWVRTDMGGPSASLAPHESANGILKVIDSLTMKDSGKYLDYRGGQHPW